jgi:hypothetical protein
MVRPINKMIFVVVGSRASLFETNKAWLDAMIGMNNATNGLTRVGSTAEIRRS